MSKENSPKLYLIKNKEGQFYNAREKVFYSNFIHANFERDFKIANSYLSLPKFSDCEVHIITEHEFMEEMASKTTNVVLAGSYFAELLKKLLFTLPTISQVNKTMYQKCKVALATLEPFTTMHSDFISKEEDNTDDVRGHYEAYISEVSNVQIYQTAEVAAIIKAYQLDKSSMLGIATKILKNKA